MVKKFSFEQEATRDSMSILEKEVVFLEIQYSSKDLMKGSLGRMKNIVAPSMTVREAC